MAETGNKTGEGTNGTADAAQGGTQAGGAGQGGASASSGSGFGGASAFGGSGSAQEMTNRMRAGGEAMAQSGQQLGLKMLDQAEINTREAFRAMRDAAQAKDLSDVMRIQNEFMREAGSRSVSHAREIGELIASFGRQTMGQFTGGK